LKLSFYEHNQGRVSWGKDGGVRIVSTCSYRILGSEIASGPVDKKGAAKRINVNTTKIGGKNIRITFADPMPNRNRFMAREPLTNGNTVKTIRIMSVATRLTSRPAENGALKAM
jgi:hypothetical protein